MSKFIDIDKFIEDLGFENTEQEREENIGEIVTLEDFDRQPISDIVEVVRCKDCKFSKKGNVVLGVSDYECLKTGITCLDADDFCSYGERKKEE